MAYICTMTIGIDIVEVARIRKAIRKWGQRFTKRIFLPAEIATCESKKKPYVCYAGHFAAKEAFSKALGTGIRILSWKDIELANDKMGKPFLIIKGKSKKLLKQRKLDVSISDTENLATAIVIIENK